MSKQAENKALPPFHLIIPAAGSASRMGMDIPKPYLKVNGTSVIRHAINKFMNYKTLQSVSIAINETHLDLYHDAIIGLDMPQCVIGSISRKNSVYNALKDLSNLKNEDIVLIHDAARPMVQERDIEALLRVMDKVSAATLATPVSDTLLKDNQPVSREDTWAIQTPQAFKYGDLMAAHEKFKDVNTFTDDAGLIRAMGGKVELVPSSRQNIKITTQDDLMMVEQMIASQTETRTSIGFDVHAFETEKTDRKLILGGIEIEHEFALTGHSDADVVLHTITDAVLGSINAGDIGTHFPPSDDQWKDMNSAHFLEEAIRMVRQQGGDVRFIDVVVMAEAPKIGPHRQAMQDRIAQIMDIPASRISIKATTTEKLGFTGRKEGIAAQAIATVRLPIDN